MDDSVQSFLNTHRTAARWLNDIIDVFIERRGTAQVSDIAAELVESKDIRDQATVEQIVTRCIDDCCSGAADFCKDTAHDLFERIKPATYRLRSYPDRPNEIDIVDLMRIEFDDPAMQSMWVIFRAAAQRKRPEQWNQADNAKKLALFVKWMALKGNRAAENERRKVRG